MNKKAEKLARELASLRLRYSDRDFDAAMEILSSGELFEAALRAATQVKSRRPRKASALSPVQHELSGGAEAAVEALFRRIGSDEAIRQFAERVLGRDLLKSNSALRAFAETLDVRLPKKLPSRIAVTERICARLLNLSPEQRGMLIDQARSMDQEVSSLQLWSDVIVRRGDKSS